MEPKSDRNKDIIKKRLSDPYKWSFKVLGEWFNLKKPTVEEIFNRDLVKYATKEEVRRYQKIAKTFRRFGRSKELSTPCRLTQ